MTALTHAQITNKKRKKVTRALGKLNIAICSSKYITASISL